MGRARTAPTHTSYAPPAGSAFPTAWGAASSGDGGEGYARGSGRGQSSSHQDNCYLWSTYHPKVRSEDEPLPPPKFHRETQTAVQQTRSQITVREAGTQMEAHGHAVVEERDVLLAPLPYFDSEQLAELRLHKAIDAQRYTRSKLELPCLTLRTALACQHAIKV